MIETFKAGQIIPRRLRRVLCNDRKAQHCVTFGYDVHVDGHRTQMNEAEKDMNFAAIVKRIRCCESEVPAQLILEHAIAEAVAAEREACAKACDRQAQLQMDTGADSCCILEAMRCARDIRARPNGEVFVTGGE